MFNFTGFDSTTQRAFAKIWSSWVPAYFLSGLPTPNGSSKARDARITKEDEPRSLHKDV
jgi:hypothetical protein